LPGQIDVEAGEPVTTPLPLPEDIIAETPGYTGPPDYVPGDLLDHIEVEYPEGLYGDPDTYYSEPDPYASSDDQCAFYRSVAYEALDYPEGYDPSYIRYEVIDYLVNVCGSLDLAERLEVRMIETFG
jgi:hypothetical protein